MAAMNKQLYIYAAVAMTLLLLTSCTHNNGDIGQLFGKWKLTSIVADGAPQPVYNGNIFWSFQSSTINMQVVSEHHDVYNVFGNWRLEDEALTLDFSDPQMPPPAELGLPASAHLQVLHLSHNKAEFIYYSTDNTTITYTLKKW